MLVKKSPRRAFESLRNVRSEGRAIGLVPTMGYLHQGHAALMERARKECDYLVVSIFVNPIQFGPGEDFERYPRDIAGDLDLCRRHDVDLVFNPSAAQFYPPGYGTLVDVGPLGDVLEGAHRPGHFRGVATVVVKLLNVVGPRRVYFGQKDAQQAVIIRKVVADLNLPVEIAVCPTVREADGLAVSSRNVYLSPEERRRATVLYRSLQTAEESIRGGRTDTKAIIRRMEAVIAAAGARIDYISVNHPDTLEPVKKVTGPVLVSLAARIGATRLIDNLVIDASR